MYKKKVSGAYELEQLGLATVIVSKYEAILVIGLLLFLSSYSVGTRNHLCAAF